MGTLTQGQISKKNFEVGPEVVQPGPELVHSNISSTVYSRVHLNVAAADGPKSKILLRIVNNFKIDSVNLRIRID